jgi:hypothetical protein
MFPSTITIRAPGIKLIVVRAQILNVRIQLIYSRKHRVVMRTNRIRSSASGNLTFPVANSYGCGIPALVNVDAIYARTRDRKSQIRRIDFVRLIPVQMTHSHQNCAFAQAHLRNVIVQIEK